jgi:hypothetical protein
VRHEKKMAWKFFHFPSASPSKNILFRVMRSKTTGYVLTDQCPTKLRSKAIEMKDDFLNSFKIVRH